MSTNDNKKRVFGLASILVVGVLAKAIFSMPILPIILVFLIALPVLFSRTVAFRYYCVMFPLFLLMLTEIVLQYKEAHRAVEVKAYGNMLPACSCSGEKQINIDRVYGDELWQKMTPLADGFRVYCLPHDYKSQYVTTDENGFRTKGFHKKANNVFRIVFLGGSAAFGWQARSDEVIASRVLEALLNQNGKDKTKYEVFNLATPCGNYLIDYVNLCTYGLELEPDLIVFLNGYNDTGGSADNIRRLGGVLRSAGGIARYEERIPIYRDTLIRWYAGKMNCTRELLKIMDKINPSWIVDEGADKRNSAMSRQSADNYRKEFVRYMERCFKRAFESHIPVIGFYQPTMVSSVRAKRAEDLTEGEKLFKQTLPSVDPTTEIGDVVAELSAIASKYNSRYEDLSRVFGTSAPIVLQGPNVCTNALCASIFITNSHWTDKGNYIVGSNMYMRVISYLKSREHVKDSR